MLPKRRLWKIAALLLAILTAAPDLISCGHLYARSGSRPVEDAALGEQTPRFQGPAAAGTDEAPGQAPGAAAALPAERGTLKAASAASAEKRARLAVPAASAEMADGTTPISRETAGKPAAVTMSWVELQRRYPGTFVVRGPRGARKVALTFDDVPDPRYTPQVLDILARHKVRATFFVVGWRAAKYPALVRRIRREGHVIGNHSYDHAVLPRLSMDAFQRQIDRTDAVIAPLAGYSPRLIRPPYGEISPRQIEWLKRGRFIVVNWNVDSVDWRGIDSRSIMANIKKTLQPGSIILQHAGGGVGQDLSGTLNALPKLIALLRGKGYEIVTLPELLGVSPAR